MKQKFKRGNLVRVIDSSSLLGAKKSDIISKDDEIQALIEYSYNEKYGNGIIDEYSIMYKSGTSLRWTHENQLELIDEGGEHLFAEFLAKREQKRKSNTDLKLLKQNWLDIRYELHCETVLFLLDKIGYKSNFLVHGNLNVLKSEWFRFHEFFDILMAAKTLKDITDEIPDEIPEPNLNRIINLFNELQ
jgi:hypothetical protein